MKSVVFTCLLSAMMLLWQPVNSQNLLYDGDFSVTTEIGDIDGIPTPEKWQKFIYNADVNVNVVDGICEFTVNSPGSENWQVQLIQGLNNLKPDYQYNLTFDVKATTDCPFVVFLGEVDGNWTTFLNGYWHNAGTEWQTISIDFNVPTVFASHKLSFEFGQLYSTTIYFDNVSVTETGPYTPSAGIIGTAVNGGWDVDVDMETIDGKLYTLANFPLNNGYMKFRLDDMWNFNFGNNTFPTGMGFQNGPDIPVPSPGNYNIVLNRETGEYSITCADNCFPYIGIIGSAVPPGFGSDPDVNLQTADGINYWLDLAGFNAGELKFRQDDKWDVNWGGTGFPDGTAIPDGPPVIVPAGNFSLTFNLLTGEYHFKYPQIGILGSALNGWDADIDMETTDGIVYTLKDYPFTDGYVKFRANDNWMNNWGGESFPTGWAWLYGPDIFVMAGTYDVTFNQLTGEYSFEATSCPVAGIQCPWGVYQSADPGMCGAYVYYSDVKAAPNCGGDFSIEQIDGLPSGSLFPVGSTINSFLLTNESGNTAFCSFEVFVYEFEPPVLTFTGSTEIELWPANHQMVNVSLDYTTYDNCDNDVQTEIYVYSNEPDDALGDGTTTPDWEIVDKQNVMLRAERSAMGTGREYYIYVVAYDDSWNIDYKLVVVKVPHDNGVAEKPKPGTKNKSAIIGSFTNNELLVDIWPNPADRFFNLKITGETGQPFVVSVADMTGRTVSNFAMNGGESTQFGEKLNPGIYNVTIRNGNSTQNIRIVKTY